MRRFVEEHGEPVGGRCGTTPDHIALLAELFGGGRRRSGRRRSCSRLFQPLRGDRVPPVHPFLIVAERTNANGSRKFKRLLDSEDWDGLLAMGREELEVVPTW